MTSVMTSVSLLRLVRDVGDYLQDPIQARRCEQARVLDVQLLPAQSYIEISLETQPRLLPR